MINSKDLAPSLKKLESLLTEPNLDKNFAEIIALIDKIDGYTLSSYTIEDANSSSLLHLVLNKPVANFDTQKDILNKLIDKNCDVNVVDSYGWTLLHYACNYNLIPIAELIINSRLFKKETINVKSTKQLKTEKYYYLIGTTPIQICAWLNNLSLAQCLVKNGADINVKNDAGWTSLHICSREANLEFLNYLIQNGCNVNEGNDHKKTPLHVASRHGNEKIARALLKSNANLSLVNNYGQTALYVSTVRGHAKIIRILFEYNADPNQADNQDNTPLHACAMLKESKDEGRNVEIGELLMQKGAQIDKKNSLGFTPLHYCAKNNAVSLANLLVNKLNTLLNMRDAYGQTALFLACKWRSYEMARFLLGKQANKDIADLGGYSPIHLCALDSSEKFISLLLEFGDDVNKANGQNSKDTPLHIAARANNSTMVAFLLKNNADVSKINKDKQTPLHLAAINSAERAALILLEGGAKINKTDNKGQTPLHACIESRFNSDKIGRIILITIKIDRVG